MNIILSPSRLWPAQLGDLSHRKGSDGDFRATPRIPRRENGSRIAAGS